VGYCPFPPYLYCQHFILVIDHQLLRWLVESDKLTDKLVRWALLLQEYEFEVVHHVGITNLDADGFSRNPSPSDEDLTGAMWHGNCDREAVPGWHSVACVTLFSGTTVKVPIQSSDDETNRPQAIANIHEDLPVLHNLHQGTFPFSTSAM
jgi:hypothetical protein